MFGNEAEEYFENECLHSYADTEEELKEDVAAAFKSGAEFGYNKAMEEWKKHFMQCSSPFCLDKFSEVKCCGELGNMAKKEG